MRFLGAAISHYIRLFGSLLAEPKRAYRRQFCSFSPKSAMLFARFFAMLFNMTIDYIEYCNLLLRYRRYSATGATTLPELLRNRRYYATGATP